MCQPVEETVSMKGKTKILWKKYVLLVISDYYFSPTKIKTHEQKNLQVIHCENEWEQRYEVSNLWGFSVCCYDAAVDITKQTDVTWLILMCARVNLCRWW